MDAATYLVSFLVLLALVRPHVARTRHAVPKAALRVRAGLSYVRRTRVVLLLACALFAIGVAFPMLLATIPVLTYERFGAHAQITGLLVTCYGAGMAAGSVLAYFLLGRLPRRPLGIGAMICLVIPLWLLVLRLGPAGVGAVLFCSAMFIPITSSLIGSSVTLQTPQSLRPQVMTIVVTSENLAGPLAYVIVGPVLQGVGVQPVFVIVAAMWSMAGLAFIAAMRARGKAAGQAGQGAVSQAEGNRGDGGATAGARSVRQASWAPATTGQTGSRRRLRQATMERKFQ